MLEDIKAILFDLDGTLIDSMWVWSDIDREYLKRFSMQLPKEFHEEIQGASFYETAVYFKNYFSIPDSLEQIQKDWNDMAEYRYTHEVQLKEGVTEFLMQAKNQGIRMGIATSNSSRLTEKVLEALGVRGYFDAVVTSDEVIHGKPAPDIYLEGAKRLAVKPGHCLVFEDVPAGIIAGTSAGMRTCAVADPFSETLWHRKCQLADIHIRSFMELVSEEKGWFLNEKG